MMGESVTLEYHEKANNGLIYVMVCIRADISHVINMVSKYIANPGKVHW